MIFKRMHVKFLLSLPKNMLKARNTVGLPPEKNSWIFPAYYWSHLQLTIKPQEIDAIFIRSRLQRLIMADTYLRCDECSKTFKTFQALVKHFEKGHVNRRIPRRAVFFEDEKEVQLMAAQAIRSPAVQEEYKAWLTGVVERLNGIHHQRHKRKFTQVTTKVG